MTYQIIKLLVLIMQNIKPLPSDHTSQTTSIPQHYTQLTYVDQSEIIKSKSISELCQRKKVINKKIWTNPEGDLQNLFLTYPFCQQIGISANNLVNLKGIKLIRGEQRIYFGQVIKTKKQGKGVSVYSDGKIYEGNHLNNQKHGLGCEIYTNGNVYIGDFDKNKKHGKGTFYWLNLHQNDIIQYYAGEWWDGLPSGAGKHQRSNGDLYSGEFRNGLKHGQGIEYFNNGDVYKGKYVNGVPEGYGQYIWSNQSNYKGEFRQGLRFGFGCWKKDNTENCESYRGNYMKDLKSGHGIYSWPDGKLYKGEFLNDKKHGFGQLYYNDILKYKGNWEEGKPSQSITQISDSTAQKIVSGSEQTNNFNISDDKKSDRSKNTYCAVKFKTRGESRNHTFDNSGNGFLQPQLKRPSTGAPTDLKPFSHGQDPRQTDDKSMSQSNLILKGCHKNCIPKNT